MFKEFIDPMKTITKALKDMDKVSANKIKSGVIGKDVKPSFFDNMEMKETRPRHIPTINENMAGEKNNGVFYELKRFKLNGKEVEGVFPVFESQFDVKLPKELYRASDTEQMKYCTKTLAEAIKNNPELKKQFDERQIKQIENGDPRIGKFTWHHSEIPGKMQLVNAKEHSAARHTGGRSLWGGGSDSR